MNTRELTAIAIFLEYAMKTRGVTVDELDQLTDFIRHNKNQIVDAFTQGMTSAWDEMQVAA